MITGTHYYDLSITMHKTKEFVNAVEYSTIVLAISLNLVYILSFQKLHRLKAQIELLEELEKKKNEELIATKKEIADAALPDKFDNLYDEIIAYFENEKPRGIAYLPNASYYEMGEIAIPLPKLLIKENSPDKAYLKLSI